MYLQDFTVGALPNPLLANPPPRTKTPPPPPTPVIEPDPVPVQPKDLGPYKAVVSRKDLPKRNVGEAARAARAAKVAAGARRMQPSMSSLHLASFPVPGQEVSDSTFRPASMQSETVSEITPVNAWVASRAAAQLTNFKESTKAAKAFAEYAKESDLEPEKSTKLVGSLGEGVGFTFKATCNFVHPNRQLPKTGKRSSKHSTRSRRSIPDDDDYGAERMNSATSDGGWQQGWSVGGSSRNNSDAGLEPLGRGKDLAPDEESDDSAEEDIDAILAAQAIKPLAPRHSLFPVPKPIIINPLPAKVEPQVEYEDEYEDSDSDDDDVPERGRSVSHVYHAMGELGALAEEEDEEDDAAANLRPGRILSHIFGREAEIVPLKEEMEADEILEPVRPVSHLHVDLSPLEEEEEEDEEIDELDEAAEHDSPRQSLAYVLPTIEDIPPLFSGHNDHFEEILPAERAASVARTASASAISTADDVSPARTQSAGPSQTVSGIIGSHGGIGALFAESASTRASLDQSRTHSPVRASLDPHASLRSIKSSLSLRRRQSETEATPTGPGRSSFERAISILNRGFDADQTPTQPLSRAAKIAHARRAFDEKEAAKERKWEERQRRKSEATERSMSWSAAHRRPSAAAAVDSPVGSTGSSSRESLASVKRSLSLSGRSAFDHDDMRSASVTRATTVADEDEQKTPEDATFPVYKEESVGGMFRNPFEAELFPPVKPTAVVVEGLFPPPKSQYYLLAGTWYDEFGDEVSADVADELERDAPKRPLSVAKQAKGKMSKLSAWGKTRMLRA